jgi:hypothetical protein
VRQAAHCTSDNLAPLRIAADDVSQQATALTEKASVLLEDNSQLVLPGREIRVVILARENLET